MYGLVACRRTLNTQGMYLTMYTDAFRTANQDAVGGKERPLFPVCDKTWEGVVVTDGWMC